MAELIGIRYSPWTEKALWALDHHKIDYKYHEHLVIFGMPSLRWKLRKFTESPTVPAFVDDSVRLADSYLIAGYADRAGSGSKLFPAGQEATIAECNAISEAGLDAGRGLMLRKLGENREAQFENLPPYLRHKALMPLVPVGLAYIATAFGAQRKSAEEHRRELRLALLKAREYVKRAGQKYVLGEFSYADIALAVLVQFVRPVDDAFIRLGPATRSCWGDAEFESEFGDLVAWRDRVYRDNRT